MILVDTSIWIDHLHAREEALVLALESGDVLTHPWIIGELSLGSIRGRDAVIGLLSRLPVANIASFDEVMALVSRRRLFGRGLSLVDAQLLASTLITPGASLWTRDKRLAVVADELGVLYARTEAPLRKR